MVEESEVTLAWLAKRAQQIITLISAVGIVIGGTLAARGTIANWFGIKQIQQDISEIASTVNDIQEHGSKTTRANRAETQKSLKEIASRLEDIESSYVLDDSPAVEFNFEGTSISGWPCGNRNDLQPCPVPAEVGGL